MSQGRLIRLPEVVEKVGLGKSTVWLWVKQHKFPKPIKLSARVTVWKESDINKWIEEREKSSPF